MKKIYSPKEIEKKWQDKWYSENTFKASDDLTLPKFYGLVEFPYPSGHGLRTNPLWWQVLISEIKRIRLLRLVLP